VATGNTFGALTWSDGEAHIRLGPGPVFSMAAADYFSPSDWATLDSGDLDIGGTGPLLIEVPGATPSKLDVVLGKDTKAYLLDATNLGGVGKPLAAVQVATASIITAPATYRTALGTYVVFSGPGMGCPNGAGDFTALRIGATNPPTITVAWCASVHGFGSPIATTSDGTHDAIVWVVGAELDNRLHGLDGDTGKVVYAGGGMAEQLGKVRRFETPIVAAGRIFVGGDNAVYAFTL
jgi:outer membrane protein assembly factor BamB